MRSRLITTAACVALAPTLFASTALAAPGSTRGPSSRQSPYLLPVAPGVMNTALLSGGDAADNGYRMVGIPDGLGAFDNGIGFDMSTSKPTSLGLRIMRERAEAIGADYHISSTPGSGTCVEVIWNANPNIKLRVL